jgi:hypothetical protein
MAEHSKKPTAHCVLGQAQPPQPPPLISPTFATRFTELLSLLLAYPCC